MASPLRPSGYAAERDAGLRRGAGLARRGGSARPAAQQGSELAQRVLAGCLLCLLALALGIDLLAVDVGELNTMPASGLGPSGTPEPTRITVRLSQGLPGGLRSAWPRGPQRALERPVGGAGEATSQQQVSEGGAAVSPRASDLREEVPWTSHRAPALSQAASSLGAWQPSGF